LDAQIVACRCAEVLDVQAIDSDPGGAPETTGASQSHLDAFGVGQGLRFEGRRPGDADVARDYFQAMIEGNRANAHPMPGESFQASTNKGWRLPLPYGNGHHAQKQAREGCENDSRATPTEQA
jgi:hypothetical protein